MAAVPAEFEKQSAPATAIMTIEAVLTTNVEIMMTPVETEWMRLSN